MQKIAMTLAGKIGKQCVRPFMRTEPLGALPSCSWLRPPRRTCALLNDSALTCVHLPSLKAAARASKAKVGCYSNASDEVTAPSGNSLTLRNITDLKQRDRSATGRQAQRIRGGAVRSHLEDTDLLTFNVNYRLVCLTGKDRTICLFQGGARG
eukprot:SAG31_NODE_1751_length_7353_cov_6.874552_6_plen_153_part_00